MAPNPKPQTGNGFEVGGLEARDQPETIKPPNPKDAEALVLKGSWNLVTKVLIRETNKKQVKPQSGYI